MKRIAATTLFSLAALLAQNAHAAQATLTWSINAPTATETRIERRQITQPETAAQQIAAVPAPTATWVDKSLTAGALYCYTVRSANANSISPPTTEVCMLAPATGIVIIYSQ